MMHMRLRAMADDAEPVIGPRSALIRWLIRPQAIATHRHIPRIRAPLESLRVKTWRIKTGELRPGESDEWLEVVFVGSLKRFDINRSSGSRGLQIDSAPGEMLAAQLHDQHIGCETRPASIAIRERMHGDQAVMESDGDVVGRIGTILVTGGTSGIGRALAEAFYARGNHVIVTGRRQALLDRITAGRPGLVGMPLDLDDPTALSRLATEIRARFGELNMLFANAGISRAEDITADGWDASDAQAVVETNILGMLRTTAAFLPILKGRSNATVIVTSSNLAFVPRADFPAYCASKAFLHSWLQSLRHQLRNIPVEVLELAPPYVQTELTGTQQASDPRAVPLDAYVAEVMQLLERNDHPRGEVLVERDRNRRWAERDGRYEDVFAAMNPG